MAQDSYVARTKPPEHGAPLIFAFHGTGGNEHQFFGLVESMFPKAGIVSPRGDVSEGGAARFFKRTGEGVYDMEDLGVRTDAMSEFVASWATAYPDSPVYAFGYSNGANILASVMMRRPNLFVRIGLLHPLIPWAPDPLPALENTRILITAGKHDPICPWPMSEQLITWAGAQGAKVSTFIHEGGHELIQPEVDALAELYAKDG